MEKSKWELSSDVFNLGFAGGVTAVIVNTIYFTTSSVLSWWLVAGLFLAFYPWKIGRNTFSLLGGCCDKGDIYSLISITQFSCEGTCYSCIGLNLNSKAKQIIFCFFGFNLNSKAEEAVICLAGLNFGSTVKGNIFCGIGFNFNVRSCKSVKVNIGGNWFTWAGEDSVVGFGIPICQNAVEFSGINWKKSNFLIAYGF